MLLRQRIASFLFLLLLAGTPPARAQAPTGAGGEPSLPRPGEPGWYLLRFRGFAIAGTRMQLAGLAVTARGGGRIPENLTGSLVLAGSTYRLVSVRASWEEVPVPIPAATAPGPGARSESEGAPGRRLVGISAGLVVTPGAVPGATPPGLPGGERGLALEDSPGGEASARPSSRLIGQVALRLVERPYREGTAPLLQGKVTVGGVERSLLGFRLPRWQPPREPSQPVGSSTARAFLEAAGIEALLPAGGDEDFFGM